MKKRLSLSKAIFDKAEKIKKDKMKDLKAAKSVESQYCDILCDACGDSIAELIYMLPDTEVDVPTCN